MDPAQYEAQLWDLMFRTMRFMLVTYVPLQVAAIVIMKRLTWRIVAALPLIPMLPVIYAGMNRDAYRDGSLYGLVFYFPYAPVMVYLAFFSSPAWQADQRKQTSRTPERQQAAREIGCRLFC